MNNIEKLSRELVSAIEGLAVANTLTGIWDNRRYQLCKNPSEKVDRDYLYITEKNSRANVELRAVHRNKMDACLKELIEKYA